MTTTLEGTNWSDILWLHHFGLNKDNALDYFQMSPFYDSKSNNQIIRTQSVSHEFLKTMVGLEFALDTINICEPHLYVIRKQNRIDPNRVQLLEIFYIVDGVIFQSPVLLDVLRTRFAKSVHHLMNSFETVAATVSYTSSGGHQCDLVSTNKEKGHAEDGHTTQGPNEMIAGVGDDMEVSSQHSSSSSMLHRKRDEKKRGILSDKSAREFPPLDRVVNDFVDPRFFALDQSL